MQKLNLKPPYPGLFLALPGYGYFRTNTVALMNLALGPWGRLFGSLSMAENVSSALPLCFNQLWCQALDRKRQGKVSHFLMLHSDVNPKDSDWLQRMVAVMEQVDAAVVSAVVPIKDDRGLTSTALETGNPWAPRRLTMTEIHKDMGNGEPAPVIFDHPDLLLNTGLMLVDFRQPWVDDIAFTFYNEIAKAGDIRKARFQPEDWDFSRQLRRLGVHAQYATTAVKVEHMGFKSYSNAEAWGTRATDAGDK